MKKIGFDRDWAFHLGNSKEWWWEEVTTDPSEWRKVDLPHDWSIELERHPDNPSGALGGFFAGGRGWYHKAFNVPDEWRGKNVFVEFEGAYMNAKVWLNGNLLGLHPYGYTSFCHDLTPHLRLDEENDLRAVIDNGCQANSRWYSGSGIYRHVWLLVAGPVHVAHWGVYVTTPEVSPEAALVRARTTVVNEAESTRRAVVRSRIVAPNGAAAGESSKSTRLKAGSRGEVTQAIKVSNPQLWSPGTPHVYQLETDVLVDGEVVDTTTTPFGIRSLCFDARQGFLLNGRPLLLKGGCAHHDNGILGAASYDRSEERRVELLKASGHNAVRCAHNPPAPAFLDACDRLGLLVIDEAFDCWREGKNPYDYHLFFGDWWRRDLESMLLRDRNHPSIIMWSIGNEVIERDGHSGGAEIAHALADHVRALDPTRPVTAAINHSEPWERTDAVIASLDVCGYNYQLKHYAPDHDRVPDRVIYGSESMPPEAFEHWMSVLEMDHVIGDFVWTSLDYLGESGIGRAYLGDKEVFLGEYPWHQANCGDIDVCGFKQPQSYYRDILWQHGDPLYIAVHYPVPEGKTPIFSHWGWPDVWPNWTWPGREGQTFTVDVYSACEKVELFLNSKSLGVKPATREEKFIATFKVPYEPGELKAVGIRGGAQVAESSVLTVGAPAAIRLTPDRSTLRPEQVDLSFVTVEIVDAQGRVHPDADDQVAFSVGGAGSLAAVGSSNPVSTEPYRGDRRRAFRGRCLIVVKSEGEPGEIRLRARADGLDGAEVVIRVG